MIVLRCSNCGRSQQLDGAFAGCVCRCQFCAAIQTVPGARSRSIVRHFWRGGGAPTLLHCPDQPAARAPRTGADLTLIFAIALAALLAVGAAGGAIAWVHMAETRSATGTGATQLPHVQSQP